MVAFELADVRIRQIRKSRQLALGKLGELALRSDELAQSGPVLAFLGVRHRDRNYLDFAAALATGFVAGAHAETICSVNERLASSSLAEKSK